MSDILNYIGKTPLIQVAPKLFAKLETYNPTGSIKDRMAYYVLTKAEERGELKAGDTIVEASSGNTGISFSMLGSVKGYKVIIILPCNMSEERKQMIRLFGATIIEVGESDFKGAIELRDKMVEENENYFSPNQFANPDNIDCHMWTTGMEIKQELIRRGEEKIAAIVSGGGTGGTIMGTKRAMEKFLDSPVPKFIMVKPAEGKVHGIQGIGDGGDYLVNREEIDETIDITTEDAIERAKKLAREHGLFVGISAGANILAAERWMHDNEHDGCVVTFLCDRGERYLSIFD
jgi:cysteine synthase A